MALAYAAGLSTGLLLTHAGDGSALRQRDKVVGTARRESPTVKEFSRGNRATAAVMDAAGNAFAAGVIMAAGYFPPAAWAMALYKGWIGGIVSVDDQHRSRLASPYQAFYYLTTILLQLLPASLLGGAGVNLAYSAFRARAEYPGARFRPLRIPYDAFRDVGWIALVSLPLFLVASLFEFFA